MDIQTLIMPVVIIAFGLFAGGMFAYRKMTAGEAFSWSKFLPTMGIGALASVVLYVASGALPSLDAILTQIELMAPGGAPSVTVILAALLALYNQFSKGSTTAAAVTTTPAAQAATVEQPKATYEVKSSGQVDVGGFKVNVPYKDVGLDPSKYVVGSLDWQHSCMNVIDAEAEYSELSSATGKPTAANPLEKAAITAAAALATFQGVVGKSLNNINENVAAIIK